MSLADKHEELVKVRVGTRHPVRFVVRKPLIGMAQVEHRVGLIREVPQIARTFVT